MAKKGKINCISLVATFLGDKGFYFGNWMHEEFKTVYCYILFLAGEDGFGTRKISQPLQVIWKT